MIDNSAPERAFVRTQLADLTKRATIRHVFGQAFHYILLGRLAVAPLLEMFMLIDSPYFVGRDPRTDVAKTVEELAQKGRDMFGNRLI